MKPDLAMTWLRRIATSASLPDEYDVRAARVFAECCGTDEAVRWLQEIEQRHNILGAVNKQGGEVKT